MVLEDHRLPQITFQIIIPGAGGYYDDPATDRAGQLHRAADARRHRDAQTRSRFRRSSSAWRRPSTSAPACPAPNATVSGNALTENFDTLFALTADVLLTPSFPADEWDRLKTRTQGRPDAAARQPGFLANEQYSRVIYGDHPPARVSATPATLDAITRDAMVAVPPGALRAGPRRDRLRRRHHAGRGAESRRGAGSAAGRSAARRSRRSPIPPPIGARKVSLVARPELGADHAARRHAVADAHGSGLRAADGRQPRARRHRSAGCSGTCARRRATPTASAAAFGDQLPRRLDGVDDVRTEVTEPALTDLLDEIAQMRDKPVPAKELADSKRAIVASFALSLENPQSVLGNYIEQLALRAAGRLLGHLPGADQRRHRRARAGGGEEILGRRAPADRRGRRRDEDRTDPRQARDRRAVRHRGEEDRAVKAVQVSVEARTACTMAR